MSSELIILALNSQLTSQTRDQIAFIGLRTVIDHENYALAMELWERFESILLQKKQTDLCKSLVQAFQNCPFLLEFKLFFLDKVQIKMSFKQIDSIVV